MPARRETDSNAETRHICTADSLRSVTPGLGLFLKDFVHGGPTNLVNLIGSATILNQIHTASSQTGAFDALQHNVCVLSVGVLRPAVPFGSSGRYRFRDSRLRLTKLAVVLAELDGKTSAKLVLDLLNIPETGKWLYGAWPCINGLEALLMQGVVLPSAKTWEIVEPIIQHARSQRWNNQELALVTHVARIVLFTDDARRSIARIGELLRENLLSVEGIRSLAWALGCSRCDDAVGLLRELAEDKVRAQYLGDAWVDAVAQLDTQECGKLLLSFVDPSLPPVPTELFAHYDGKLVNKVTQMAQRDANVQRRLFQLVHSDLSPAQAKLLGKVLARLGTTDAILSALDLLRDDGTSGASYELHEAIQELFVEQRPYRDSSNAMTMVPRSSNAIRSKLLDMVQNDPRRRNSALALLNEIEEWRMWHGRPDGEPRSPTLEDGFFWP
jgi:hypothetical protein